MRAGSADPQLPPLSRNGGAAR